MSVVKIWVDPEFKKELKKKSAEENKSIIQLTKELASKIKDGDSKNKNDKSFKMSF